MSRHCCHKHLCQNNDGSHVFQGRLQRQLSIQDHRSEKRFPACYISLPFVLLSGLHFGIGNFDNMAHEPEHDLRFERTKLLLLLMHLDKYWTPVLTDQSKED